MKRSEAHHRLARISKIMSEHNLEFGWSIYDVNTNTTETYNGEDFYNIDVELNDFISCCGLGEVHFNESPGKLLSDEDANYFFLCLILEAVKCVGISSNKAMLIASINHKQAAWEPAFDFIGFQKIFEGINPGTKNPIKVYMLDLTKAV